MNIIIVGYGKVGQKVAQVCKEKNITIKAIVSPNNPKATHKRLDEVKLLSTDTIIDFSHYTQVLKHTTIASEIGCNIVMGTAGWHDQENKIKSIVENKIGFIYAHNFMLSAKDFWQTLVFMLDKIKKENTKYQCWVTENLVTWASKSYSSTAFYTTEIVAKKFKKTAVRKKSNDKKFLKNQVYLKTTLNGKNPLDITVHLKSKVNYLKFCYLVTDKEKSNIEYAEGAIVAALKIQNKKGFFML